MYEPTCQGHFALANPHYLHFTSPLRRLADFIVHRIVKAELAGKQSPYTEDEINDLADSINDFNLDDTKKLISKLLHHLRLQLFFLYSFISKTFALHIF